MVDDGEGSLYNGDENHKVWTGSSEQLDVMGLENHNHYDIYGAVGSGSTLGRPARARQISAPIPVPPPPKEELIMKKKKDKKSKMSPGSQSLSGTLIRPRPMHMAPMGRGPPHPMMMYPIGPPPPPGRQFHTIGHRSMNGNSGPPMLHHPQMPMHMQMPMPIMMPQQYATLQHPRTSKKKKNKNEKMMNGGIPIGVPVVPPMFAYPPPPGSVIEPIPRPLGLSNRKLAASAADGLNDSGNSGAESPGGTGIYRRKGHMNERAFSYSIRQEHRSRSHGSLASLQFSPPDMKKEREIAQMVAGLELSDDSTLRRHEMAGSSGTFGKPRR